MTGRTPTAARPKTSMHARPVPSASSSDRSESTTWQMELHLAASPSSPDKPRQFALAMAAAASSSNDSTVSLSALQVEALLREASQSGAMLRRAAPPSAHSVVQELRTFLLVEHLAACARLGSFSDDESHPASCAAGCQRTIVRVSSEHEALPASACGVCFEKGCKKKGEEDDKKDGMDETGLVRCGGCTSHTCKTCYASWIATRVADGAVGAALTCAHCRTPVPGDHVALYCVKAVARRHAYFVSRVVLRGNPHAVWCANDECRAVLHERMARLDTRGPDLRCLECDVRTCRGCHGRAHEGANCVVPAAGIGGEVKSKIWEKIHAKRCPGCDVWIQRDGGCSNMKCTQCGITFCYRCRKRFIEVSGHAPRGDCMCSKAHEAGMWTLLVGGTIVVVPVLLAAAVVAVPPAVVVVAFLPKRSRRNFKEKWNKWIDSFKEN